MQRASARQDALAATKAKVLTTGRELAAELAAMGIDTCDMHAFLDCVDGDEFDTIPTADAIEARRLWRKVKPDLEAKADALRAGRSIGGRADAQADREAQGGAQAVEDGDRKVPDHPNGEDSPLQWQPITEVEKQFKRLSPTDCSILLVGETGTGKELLAKRIRKASSRSEKPFVVINCATLPKERIDSELFGHVKGAFTGATQDYAGKIREAEGGTVFLDEIGALPDNCWSNLLRFLQDKEIHPVGGRTATVDVRILAATNTTTPLGSLCNSVTTTV